MREILVKLQNMIARGRVDRPGAKPQFVGSNGTTYPDTEYMQPQGVHFALPADAQGAILAPNGQTAAAVAVCHSGDLPSDTVLPGEGGLHLLGTFKVYLNLDGTLSLGEQMPADFVALASLVDQSFAHLKAAIDLGFTAVGVGAAASGPLGKTAFDNALAAPGAGILATGSEKVRCS